MRSRSAYIRHSPVSAQINLLPTNQIRTELPGLTEDSVAQMSREKHASLADEFSLIVEDIPPVRRIHTAAAGFHMVVPMLKLVEKKGAQFEGICHVLRSYIACYLTENETALYLK